MFEAARARIEALQKPSQESEDRTMAKNGTRSPKGRKTKLPPGVPEGAQTFGRDLPVPLGDGELQAKGAKAAKLDDECDELTSKLKSVGKELRDDLKMKRGQIRALHKEISSGTEDRKVLCYEQKDYGKGLVRVVRTDTGVEVESRVMDAGERQEALPLPRGRASRGGKAVNGAGARDEPEEGEDAEEAGGAEASE